MSLTIHYKIHRSSLSVSLYVVVVSSSDNNVRVTGVVVCIKLVIISSPSTPSLHDHIVPLGINVMTSFGA